MIFNSSSHTRAQCIRIILAAKLLSSYSPLRHVFLTPTVYKEPESLGPGLHLCGIPAQGGVFCTLCDFSGTITWAHVSREM